ncbi:unnamed protein product [Microthlaspi erraticum]|uniref:Uncharacterized protein n=1 Tax=Microthlaspi erraticum TaxID=1685480 RepID=A0A6D2HQ51_9BRAS|nr:unnamed protein product [Microthlaspi erraticum]
MPWIFVAVVRFGRPNCNWTRNPAEADRLLPGSTVTVGLFRLMNPAKCGLFPSCLCVLRGRFCRAKFVVRPSESRSFPDRPEKMETRGIFDPPILFSLQLMWDKFYPTISRYRKCTDRW